MSPLRLPTGWWERLLADPSAPTQLDAPQIGSCSPIATNRSGGRPGVRAPARPAFGRPRPVLAVLRSALGTQCEPAKTRVADHAP